MATDEKSISARLRPFLARRPRLIYPKFQLALVGIQFLVTAICLGVVGWEHHQSFEKFRAVGQHIGLAEDHAYFEFLRYQSSSFFQHLVPAFIVGLLISILATLFLSHRIAGPIVRLGSYLQGVSSKTLPAGQKLKFRKRDFFGDLPEKVNAALEAARRDGR